MPELPEVETVRKILEKSLVGKTIKQIEVFYPRMIQTDLNEFQTKLINQRFKAIERIGKYLIFKFTNDLVLVSHLRMEGKYFEYPLTSEKSSHCKVLFYLDDELLCYDDVRCFGTMALYSLDNYLKSKELSKLGPEPFDIKDPNYLYEKFQSKKTNEIKTCLLNQEIMTGLGNIYVDEVLFRCKINPYRKANTITIEECQQLLSAAVEVLTLAISLGGSTVDSYHPALGVDGKFQTLLQAYGRKDQECCNCHSIMRKDFLGGRGTTYCPSCQNVAIRVGITGKIASGKSTVLNLFKSYGAEVFSCDQEIDNLYKHDVNFKKGIVELFGENVINDKGSIEKGYIKQVVSNDLSMKKKLENYIHPLVKKKANQFILEHKESKLVILEVPLLFESKMNLMVDYTIGVSISSINQLRNLNIRDTKNVKLDLLLNDSNRFDKNASKCDFLIDNNGSLDELKEQVAEIIKVILNRK